MADNNDRTHNQRDESTATVDKQKSRKTSSFVFRLFILSILTSLIWVFVGIFGESRAVPTTTSAVPQKPSTPLQTCTRLITYIVRPGDTFLSILTRHGIPPEMAMTLHRTFKPLGLSALFPGDSCVMSLSGAGVLSGFSVLNRLQNWYHVSVDSGSMNAHKAPAATATQRCLVRGTLSTSLSEDLFSLGVGDACVSKFADIFAWDINFFVDPQPGDSFEIIFEKKYAEGRYMGYGDILAAKYVNNGHVFYAVGMTQDKGPVQYYDPDGKSLQKEFLKAPLRFNHISSRFSLHRLHPVLGIVRPHLGIDYAAPSGTPVFSAADGRIASAGIDGGYGNHIRVSHGGSYETSYGHLSAFASGIHAGVFVKQGDCIGYVGTTGLTTGPHLDYRMTRGGRFVNPLTVSLPRKGGVGADEMQAFYVVKGEYGALLSCRLTGMEGCYLLDLKASTNAVVAAVSPTGGKTGPAPAAGMPGS
jgi:murein DD-endopeptidase MepM/ murein hydrolase activator NlpD